MDGPKIKMVLTDYADMLRDRYGESGEDRNPRASGREEKLGHIAWMCRDAIRLVDEGRVEKAHRWLGFIQGSLWMAGVTTIEDAKRASMPEGDEYMEDRR